MNAHSNKPSHSGICTAIDAARSDAPPRPQRLVDAVYERVAWGLIEAVDAEGEPAEQDWLEVTTGIVEALASLVVSLAVQLRVPRATLQGFIDKYSHEFGLQVGGERHMHLDIERAALVLDSLAAELERAAVSSDPNALAEVRNDARGMVAYLRARLPHAMKLPSPDSDATAGALAGELREAVAELRGLLREAPRS